MILQWRVPAVGKVASNPFSVYTNSVTGHDHHKSSLSKLSLNIEKQFWRKYVQEERNHQSQAIKSARPQSIHWPTMNNTASLEEREQQ